jgi:hypothetical protein
MPTADYMRQFRLVRTEGGPRFAQEGTFEEFKLTVATGYDAMEDRWPYHVYVESPGQDPEKLVVENAFGKSEQDAFRKGFQFLGEWFERRAKTK